MKSPTKEGFYWARVRHEPKWTIVQVQRCLWINRFELVYWVLGNEEEDLVSKPSHHIQWGKRILRKNSK